MKIRIVYPLAGLLCGIIFGLGLAVSQMTNPDKVLAFLDVFGQWDPSLLLTMAGAIAVTTFGYRLVMRRGSVLMGLLHLPTRSDIDTRLLLGSAIFGIGWGLAGYCPGPVLTGVANDLKEPLVFLAAMIAGSQLEKLWLKRHPDNGSERQAPDA
jgi:uncharacterized membrane protein YedE/YeeE